VRWFGKSWRACTRNTVIGCSPNGIFPEIYVEVARDHHSETLNGAGTLLLALRISNLVCRKISISTAYAPSLVPAATAEVHALGVRENTLAELEIVIEDTAAAAF